MMKTKQEGYLQSDEMILDAYQHFKSKHKARPTQQEIADMCGLSRKTVNVHLKDNRTIVESGIKNIMKKDKIEYVAPYKRIVWSYLLYGEKTAVSVADLRHGPLKKIPASSVSNHLRTLVEDGIVERAKKRDRCTFKLVWHYWKHEEDVVIETEDPTKKDELFDEPVSCSTEYPEENVEARIAALEADIKHIQGQYTELAKTFDAKKLDSQLKNLEQMRDIEQAKFDALEKDFKKWNDQENKMRQDVLR